MSLLEVRGITAGYGANTVLRQLSVHVEANEVVGLFGPNGHGKTTLLRTISGLNRVREGSIQYGEESISNLSPRSIVELGLIQVPQGNTLFPEMTVIENLKLGAYPKRSRKDRNLRLEQAFGLFPRLKERHHQRAGTLSGGERQMLSISVGLMSHPHLLMLDEPTLGLAPVIKKELGQAVAEIALSNTTLIIVDQDLEFLQQLCHRLYMLDHGEITNEFSADTQLDHEAVLEIYFGKD